MVAAFNRPRNIPTSPVSLSAEPSLSASGPQPRPYPLAQRFDDTTLYTPLAQIRPLGCFESTSTWSQGILTPFPVACVYFGMFLRVGTSSLLAILAAERLSRLFQGNHCSLVHKEAPQPSSHNRLGFCPCFLDVTRGVDLLAHKPWTLRQPYLRSCCEFVFLMIPGLTSRRSFVSFLLFLIPLS